MVETSNSSCDRSTLVHRQSYYSCIWNLTIKMYCTEKWVQNKALNQSKEIIYN